VSSVVVDGLSVAVVPAGRPSTFSATAASKLVRTMPIVAPPTPPCLTSPVEWAARPKLE
jgi:hypothetical protein